MRDLNEIEDHFRGKQELLGNLADPEEFEMVFKLIDQVKRLEEDIDRLTMLNRHYFFRFYKGDIEAMKRDCSYLF
jgi:hypothetical protein